MLRRICRKLYAWLGMQQSVQGPSAGRVSANQACKCQKRSIVPFKVWSTYDNDEVGEEQRKALVCAFFVPCIRRRMRSKKTPLPRGTKKNPPTDC